MKRAALLFAPVLVGACSAPSGVDLSSASDDATAIAHQASSFRVAAAPHSLLLHRAGAATAALRPAIATGYAHANGWLEPSFADAQRTSRPATVALGDRFCAGFRLVDQRSGVEVSVAPLDAREAHAQLVDGYVVYATSSGVSTVHRATPTGTEDFVLFDAPPEVPELAYSLTLGDGARSLRLVGGTLEVLDAAGAPRLRAARPFVVGADGVRRPAGLTVEGCAVDTDPRAPWGRAHPDPGARTCTVRVRWPDVAYPALVDPAWETTGDLANPRWFPSAALLPSGRALVVGSPNENSCSPMTAEVYDPASTTWAATGSPASPACYLALTTLDSGLVLATGDYALLYDEASGTWAAAGTFGKRRVLHTATLLDSGEVLVAGGQGGSDPNFLYFKTAELFDPVTTSWHTAASMADAHIQHTATLLSDGRVLVAGGDNGGQPGTNVAEIYDPAADAWTQLTMTSTRAAHTATLLPSGAVLVVGGFGDFNSPRATAEMFDPVAGAFSPAGALTIARDYHSASLLPTGEVLIAGGGTDNQETPTATVEIWSESTGFRSALSLGHARYLHTATSLASGAVLVAGGDGGTGFTQQLLSAEVTVNLALALGAPCAAGVDCTTGFCSNGVCCESACAAPCDVCSMALGAPADGTCAIAAAGSPGAPSCAPYLCDGTSSACGATCASSADCAPSAHCDTGSGTCIETGLDGAPCSTGATCLSGFCADGVCCDSACDGKCESCTAAGKGEGVDGICDNAAMDTDPHSDCMPPECGGTLFFEVFCDGHGACMDSKEEDCSPYVCNASGCLTHCTGASDCAPKFDCVSGACVHQASSASSAATTSAGPGATSGPGGGAGGAGAGGGGTGGESGGGCGCRLAEDAPRPSWPLALVIALAAWRRRRPGHAAAGPDD